MFFVLVRGNSVWYLKKSQCYVEIVDFDSLFVLADGLFSLTRLLPLAFGG
jgi:hypothetical protein